MFLNLILNRKFSFEKNKRVDLLILDDNAANLNFSGIEFNKIEKNKINLRYLLIAAYKYFFSLKKGKKLYEYYFMEIVNSYDPQVAIGHEMSNKIFLFSKLFPKKISITYQFSHIFKNDIVSWKNILKKKSSTYYAVFDERSAKILSRFIKSKFIITGSVKSNEMKFNYQNYKKKYDLMFISTFRTIKKKNSQQNNLHKNSKLFNGNVPNDPIAQNKKDSVIIKLLSEFCKKNKKKLVVALSSSRKDKSNISSNDEINFFKKYAPNFYMDKSNSDIIAKKTNVCVCTNSTLGYELLLSGKKVFFYSDKREKYSFFNGKNSPFWHSGPDSLLIDKKLNKLLKMNYKNWSKIKLKYLGKKKYDLGNKKLKKIIKKIITNNERNKDEKIYI